MKFFIRFIIISILFSFLLSQSIGKISGRIIDKETHQPLPGVNIIIMNTDMGAASNSDGYYFIKKIPSGSYTMRVEMMGYTSIKRANVNIASQKTTQVNFSMKQSVLVGEGINVTEGFFEKTNDAIVSNRSMDYEEIRSDPVGIYDIQMMLQALPAVASESDQSNEIIVRGGAPGENLFIMDNMEIPNPNHFGEVGTGGGAINLINTNFIDRIDFFAGGFPAKYGDKQSSVMDVTLREGNKDKTESEIEANMAGLGASFEGPLFNKKASYMASYRKSFLKYVIKSAGLTAVPEYWNSQMKIVYDLSNREKIIFNFITGIDEIDIEDENRPDLREASYVSHRGGQSAMGLSYKSLFSKNGYYEVLLGRNVSSWNNSVYNKTNEIKDIYFSRDNVEQDTYLKNELVYKLSKEISLSGGFKIKRGGYQFNEFADPDTGYVYYYYDNNQENFHLGFLNLRDYYSWVDSANIWFDNITEKHFDSREKYDNWLDTTDDKSEYPIVGVYDSSGFGNFINPGLDYEADGAIYKHSAYTQLKLQMVESLIINMGLHYDYIPYNKTNKISPRVGFTYYINPITLFNVAYGEYYQTPFYWMLLNPKNIENGDGSPLSNSYTKQFVVGLERYFSQDIKVTLEIYNKLSFNNPVYKAAVTPDVYDSQIGFDDIGEGSSNGIELFIQKKYSNNWYTTFSYSNSTSKAKDPRESKDGTYSNTFDYGEILTFIGGYKFRFREYEWYNQLRSNPVFQAFSILPFLPSDILEISFRYKYMGGRPYTEPVYNPSLRRWIYNQNIDWNTERYDSYSRLDVMLLRRFNFKRINIITYIDIQNIFDRNNQWEYLYLTDGKKEMAYQYKQLPIGGFTIEF